MQAQGQTVGRSWGTEWEGQQLWVNVMLGRQWRERREYLGFADLFLLFVLEQILVTGVLEQVLDGSAGSLFSGGTESVRSGHI